MYDNRIHCTNCACLVDCGGESCCDELGLNIETVEKCPEGSFDHSKDKEFIVPVTWEACGFIKVTAASAEEACQMVHENPDDYPLPYQSEYVDASFDISGDIEEAAAMSEIFTKDYNDGKWGQHMIFQEKEGK